VQGKLLYALVVCALCLSMVLSWMCRVIALALVRDLSSSSDRALCLFSTFDRLLEFLLFVCFFQLFPFL
jgi:hypothetical protein